VIVQWDKESVEDAGLIKIDLLSLRTLGAVTEALEHIREGWGVDLDLESLPLDDPAVYAMLQRADTIGCFQVESRAQAQMLPRLRPTCFEDLVIEVALVRPGPIQGNMVRPYLRRRQGLEPVTYPHPCLEPALKETLGVMVFQEQVLRVAQAVAKMNLKHAVITSVNRDERRDGGAPIFAMVIKRIRQIQPGCSIEVLIPDFKGSIEALRIVMEARPEILNHNVETVPRLFKQVQPQDNYEWAKATLSNAKQLDPEVLTKSGIMVGLGETMDEVKAVMDEVREDASREAVADTARSIRGTPDYCNKGYMCYFGGG